MGRIPSMPLLLTASGFLTVVALLAFAVFLRPVETKTSTGAITGKLFQPGTTYTQSHASGDRGFQSSTSIPIAESYLFYIRIDGIAAPGRISLNTIASKNFQVGQRVRVEYEERGIPLIWKRLYVNAMEGLP